MLVPKMKELRHRLSNSNSPSGFSTRPSNGNARMRLCSWDEVGEKVGISGRHAWSLANVPGASLKADKITRWKIDEAHANHSPPFPLPPFMVTTREDLSKLKEFPGTRDLMRRIIEVEEMLVTRSPRSWLEDAGTDYLLAFTAMSKGLHHGDKGDWFGGRGAWLGWMQSAESLFLSCHLKVGKFLLDTTLCPMDKEVLEKLGYAAFNNWMCSIAGQVKYGRPRADVETILFQNIALEHLKRFLEENPFLWQAASNGLEIASRLRANANWRQYFKNNQKADSWMLYFTTSLRNWIPAFRTSTIRLARFFRSRARRR